MINIKEKWYYLIYLSLLLSNLLIIKMINPISNSQKTWFLFGVPFSLINLVVLTYYINRNKEIFPDEPSFARFFYRCFLVTILTSLSIILLSKRYFFFDLITLPALSSLFISAGILSIILTRDFKGKKGKDMYTFKKEHLIIGLSAVVCMKIFPYMFKLYFPALANIFFIVLIAGLGGAIGGLIGWKITQLIFKK